MHINYFDCIYAVHYVSGWALGLTPLPTPFKLWKPSTSAVAAFSQILKPWGSLGSKLGEEGWLTSIVPLTGEKKKNHGWEALHDAGFKDLSDAGYLLNYIQKKRNYISRERRRDIIIFALPVPGSSHLIPKVRKPHTNTGLGWGLCPIAGCGKQQVVQAHTCTYTSTTTEISTSLNCFVFLKRIKTINTNSPQKQYYLKNFTPIDF